MLRVCTDALSMHKGLLLWLHALWLSAMQFLFVYVLRVLTLISRRKYLSFVDSRDKALLC